MKGVCGCLVLALCLVLSARAQSPTTLVVTKVGEYLLGVLRDYIVGKAIDQTVDFLTKKQELADAQQSLVASLADRTGKSEASIVELKQQLRETQVELSVFQKLESGTLNDEGLKASMKSVQNVLDDHERRIAVLEVKVAKLEDALSSEAMYNLGEQYRYGHGVAQDFQRAFLWYELAAEAGNADAMVGLGDMYDSGYGVPQDYFKAREWFEKAAARSNRVAMFLLGTLYNRGNGVPQDYRKARQWYEKAAVAGDGFAMIDLGEMYFEGNGVAQDAGKARQWFQKAADGDDISAHGLAHDWLEHLPELEKFRQSPK